MGKIRSIHPDATESHTLGRLSAQAERTFWRLLPHTDDHGRGKYDPLVLRSKLYAAVESVTPAQVESDFAELVEVGVVALYEHRGKRYYHVTSWAEYQKPKYKSESRIVAPDAPDVTPVTPASPPDQGKVAPPSPPDVPHGVGVGIGVGGGGGDGKSPRPSPEELEAEFEAWWEAYPRHAKNGKPGGGGDKQAARKAFMALTAPKRKAAIDALPHYRAWVESPDGEFPKHASTWLHKQSWETWETPANVRHIHAEQMHGDQYWPDGTKKAIV